MLQLKIFYLCYEYILFLLDPVMHHNRLHELVLSVKEVVGLAHGEAAALSHDLVRRAEVGAGKGKL